MILVDRPLPLVERRPGFSIALGDTVVWGHADAITEADRRARMTGRRHIVTRCYDNATRRNYPLLRRAWRIQAER